MGCCEQTQSQSFSAGFKITFDKKSDSSFQRYLEQLLSSDPSKTVDSEWKIGTETIPLLAYSLLKNLPSKFKLLHEKFGASFVRLEGYFQDREKSPMDIICEQGLLSILEYYLPHYLQLYKPHPTSEDFTLLLDNTTDRKCYSPLTPIQLACQNKQYAILAHLFNYFSEESPPPEFNIDYQDETSGECCASIAVKSGEIGMVKYLYENNTNFFVVNKRGESLLQIAAIWSNRRRHENFLTIFKFLIEQVGLDPTYNFEEVLLVVQDLRVISFYEEKLRLAGIYQSKADCELKGDFIASAPVLQSASFIEAIEQTKFNKQSIPKDSRSSLFSSIESNSFSKTPFISELIPAEDK